MGTNNGTFYAIDKEGREKWKRQWPIKNANVTDEGGIIKQHPAGSTFEIERDWITIGVDGGRSVLVQVGRVESVQDHLGMYDAARSGDSTRALALGEKLAETQSKDPMIALKSQLSMARAYALCVGHLASRNEILDREDQMSRAVDRCLGILETILSNPLVDQNPAAKRGLRRERDFDAIRQRPDFAKLFESHE